MFASHGGNIQHFEAVRLLIILLACIIVRWWRVIILIITIALITFLGFGIASVMHK
jgi:hypothetical protein